MHLHLSNYPLLSRVSLLPLLTWFSSPFCSFIWFVKAKRVLGGLPSLHVNIVFVSFLWTFFLFFLSYRQLASLTISTSLLYDFPCFFFQTKIVYLGLTKAELKAFGSAGMYPSTWETRTCSRCSSKLDLRHRSWMYARVEYSILPYASVWVRDCISGYVDTWWNLINRRESNMIIHSHWMKPTSSPFHIQSERTLRTRLVQQHRQVRAGIISGSMRRKIVFIKRLRKEDPGRC